MKTKIRVNKYRRNDGTPVKTHTRKIDVDVFRPEKPDNNFGNKDDSPSLEIDKNLVKKPDKEEKVSFYSVDSDPKSSWKSIGVSGEIVEELSNEEMGGVIVDYSYIKGNDEFLMRIQESGDEFDKYAGRYFLLVHDDGTATVKKEGKSFGDYGKRKEIKWGKTIQFRTTEKKKKRLKELGIEPHEGYKITKQLTPTNAIKEIFKNIKDLQEEK